MTRLTLNAEFLRRHLFALVAMLGIGGWFAYDGLVVYPRTDAAALYESIEKRSPPPDLPRERLEAFKLQKIRSQYGFAAFSLLAALAIGAHLAAVSRFRMEYDDAGFALNGRRHAFSDAVRVDDGKWKSKGRSRVFLADGSSFVLDAWHFSGAENLHSRFAKIPPCAGSEKIV